MKNKITIMSRTVMERMMAADFPDNTAVVSFYDPKTKRNPADYKPIDYSGICDRVFPIALHDIDLEILGEYGMTFDTYFPQADDLARFIISAVSDGCDIICQCEYGQSRSAACAAAIQEFFDRSGIEVFADYRYYPNQLVFNKLLAALRRAAQC